MSISETAGTWGQAEEIELPANAISSESGLLAIACPGSESCIAVGDYISTSPGIGGFPPMAAIQTGGMWSQAHQITTLPANAGIPHAEPFGLACPSAESCVAVGDYDAEESGEFQPMALDEASGVWNQASEITPPAQGGSLRFASFFGIACPAVGSCVAVGDYEDGSGDGLAMVASEGTAPPSEQESHSGGSGSSGNGAGPAPLPQPAPSPVVHKKVVTCKKGLKRKRVKGKTKCVKVKTHRAKHSPKNNRRQS